MVIISFTKVRGNAVTERRGEFSVWETGVLSQLATRGVASSYGS